MKSKLFILQILKGKTDELRQALQFCCGHALAYDPGLMDEQFETTWDEIINKGGTIQ